LLIFDVLKPPVQLLFSTPLPRARNGMALPSRR
jgi:hypothetical protein